MMRPAYVEAGSGPPIVFAHGTLMDDTMFAPQVEHLKGRYRVISLNHRVLSGRNVLHTLDDLVEDCRAVLDTLGIERCVLGGMSLGGFMALPFALKYPERLDGLILMATTSSDYPKDEREKFFANFGQLNIDGMVPPSWAEWVAPYVWGETTMKTNRKLVDHWIKVWTTSIPARSVYHQGMAWIPKKDDTAKLGSIKTPTLVLHGEEDHPIPIERAERMARAIPNSTFAAIPGAGHTCNLEAPGPVNKAIDAFLARVYPRARA
jgi:pimeloyl-ACP methyl ester carboxylesterase